jgi:UDP-glucose 4-epimerase
VKILVTGSNGFFGGGFGRHAARAGHELLGAGRASQPSEGWPGSYAQADVSTSDLSELFSSFRPELILHAAGAASVGASLKSPLDDLRASVLTWSNALDSVRRSGARPLVVFPSSAAIYGDPRTLPVGEREPARPISPYGYHKAACELLAREYAECFGLPVIVCRLFSVFGESQRRLLVWELYRQLADASPVAQLEGTGHETRDYLHVEDAAAAVLELAEGFMSGDKRFMKGSKRAVCTTVNVASGEETRVLDLAEHIRSLVAPSKEIRCLGLARAGDPQRWRADISLLRTLAPRWHPRPFGERLARCVAAWHAGSAATDL